MMARLATKPFRNTSPRPGHVPPLPHPSWRLAQAGVRQQPDDRIASAQDFWSRLGL